MKNSFIYSFFRKKDLEKIESKICMLGINKKIDLRDFLYKRILISFFVAIISYFLFLKFFVSIVVFFIFYFLYSYFYIDFQLKKRMLLLEREAIIFFELLILSLSSSDLKRSLNIVCNNYSSSISDEFKEALKRIEYGKPLNESIKEITSRIPSETVNNIIINIIYSNEYGNDLVSNLKKSIIYLREKKIMDIRLEINKIPNKVSVYSVLLFLPLILLIILSPILIRYLFA